MQVNWFSVWKIIRKPSLIFLYLLQVEVKRALPKEVQQQQAALRAAVAGKSMIPAAIGECVNLSFDP